MEANRQNRAVFLDKDGTLMEDIPYNSDPKRFVFSPGVVDGLGLLAQAGFRLVIVSNQSGVARGHFDVSALLPMEERLREMFSAEGLVLDGIYWCPHFPGGANPQFGIPCSCRKPAPGMIFKAGTDLCLDLKGSWMIGDRESDVQSAHNAGCHSAFLHNIVDKEIDPLPDLVSTTFLDLARKIVSHTIETLPL